MTVNRAHERLTPEEHWYIRNAAGIIPRDEIARDLQRTPLAVKTYLRDHGLHSYDLHGWSLSRLAHSTGISLYHFDRAVKNGSLPAMRGTKSYYVQPADLVGVVPVDWNRVPELEHAARRGWQERLVTLLAQHGRGGIQ